MISYWKCKDGFNEIHQWKSGCWIKVTKPTDDDLALLKERFAVPDFTHDAKDIEERPRVDHEDNWSLVFVRVPNKSTDEDGDTVFSTAPLAVLIRDDVFITVSYYDNEVLDDFIRWSKQRHINNCKGYDLLLSLMLSTSVWYLKYLKQMNAMMNAAEDRLENKMDNDELMRTMGLGKFLIYFITSLNGNMTVLARLKKRLRNGCRDRNPTGTRHRQHLQRYLGATARDLFIDHRQQPEPHHEDAHCGDHPADDSNGRGGLLRHERAQSHGELVARIPLCHHPIDCAHGGRLHLYPPQQIL